MVRPLTSALALVCTALCFGQSFGRFGYSELPIVPGFRLSAEGFRSSSGGATTLKFLGPLSGFKPSAVNDRAALYLGPETVGLPSKIRANLRSPGFGMYFPFGMTLKCDTLQSPYLSWSEASVGPDVPTPKVPWILVTFQDKQPPVLLVFESGPVELVTTGTSADWTLATRERYAGWVRVVLPFGHNGRAATGSSSLGEIVKELLPHIEAYSSPIPNLVSFDIRTDAESVTAVWTFDRPGAIVPPPALLARVGGYPVEVLSGIRQTPADLWEGPTTLTAEPKLAIKFPIRQVPVGRSIAIGPAPTNLIAIASPFDVPSLSELALAGLLSGRDEIIQGALDTVTEMFLLQAATSIEPFLQKRLPYAFDGTQCDLVAAHALVSQIRGSVAGADRDNPLFAQVAWRRDWYSWLVWAESQKVSRRASALLAVSGALSQVTERRLDACMFQAGLAAERALAVYRDRRGFNDERKDLIEPLFNLRAGLFLTIPNAFVDSLLSEVRIVTGQAVTAEVTADGVVLKFASPDGAPQTFVFEIGRPVTALPGTNVKSLVGKQSLGRLIVDLVPAGAGEVTFLLKSPGWSNPLPVYVAPPRYAEN